MRLISNAIASGTLVAALTLTGCGSSSSPTATAARERRKTIALESPALTANHAIPRRYTCDGKNISLPLEWSGVPPETKELVLFAFSLSPAQPNAQGGSVTERITLQWAVAGLQPTLHGLAAGKLPHGAVVGRNKQGHVGYSICPSEGSAGHYLFLLFASPQRLSPRPGFNGGPLFGRLRRMRPRYGGLTTSYSRE
jgi:phosphatidylethanolamine-binding protein (PEBP) family uncharacterized protein